MILGFDELANLGRRCGGMVKEIGALLIEEQASDEDVSMIQSPMKGIPSTLGILHIEIKGRMLEKRLEKVMSL